MIRDVITINDEEFRFYIAGCRADYYVSRNGDVYSRSHSKGLLKKRKPDYCGHKYPTIRIKIYENDVVVTKNFPLYRMVYETYVDRMPNWSSLGIKFRDGDPRNASIDNLQPYPRGGEALLASMSSKCCQYEIEYKKNFNRVVDYVRWIHKLSLMDSEDVAQDAFIYASLNHDGNKGDFRVFWIGVALKRAKSKWLYGRQVSLDESEFATQSASPEDLSLLLKVESLTEPERYWLSFLIQGYTRKDILKKPGMRTRRNKIVLKEMFEKIKEVYNWEDL